MLRCVLAGVLSLLSLGFPGVSSRAAAEDCWYVYRDSDSKENHGHWTNWMPEEAGKMIKLGMVDKRDPHSGASCVRVDVRLMEPGWCGIAVSCQADFWGEKPSDAAYNLTKAKKLVFHARGERGGESIQVKLGITGEKPFGDSAKAPAESEWVSLTKGWKKYEVDLQGVDLKRVVTPFVFVTNKDFNRARDFTFYLDDIYVVMGE